MVITGFLECLFNPDTVNGVATQVLGEVPLSFLVLRCPLINCIQSTKKIVHLTTAAEGKVQVRGGSGPFFQLPLTRDSSKQFKLEG